MTKYIFVMGGVCSSLGKGIASATIGLLLKRMGYTVLPIKIDPYLNVDPGTMSPERHGEVFVTEDGSETDLDLGHYERFLDQPLCKGSTLTMGRVYQQLLHGEREGKYLGRDIQVVPHVTNVIKEHIRRESAEHQADITIVELGGTIGDIEGPACTEAIRQMIQEEGRENAISIVLTLLPYLKSSGELKTKPTQVAMKTLQGMGVVPDIVLARSDYPMGESHIEKISLFCNVDKEAVLPAYTLSSIYAIPEAFQKHNVHKIVLKKLGLEVKHTDVEDFKTLANTIAKETLPSIRVGMVIKYGELDDAYLSVHEAIKAAAYSLGCRPIITHINAVKLEEQNEEEWDKLKKQQGLLVPGGFGDRGIEGKILAAQHARENNIPYFGICLGSQVLAIEFARNVMGLEKANSVEFDAQTPYPVVHLMEDQKSVERKGGTMRKGAYRCTLQKGTKAHDAYNTSVITERHRHRFEFNNDYRTEFMDRGLVVSGECAELGIMEIIELRDHPFMLGSQFHPEFASRPTKAHPLFVGFAQAILQQNN